MIKDKMKKVYMETARSFAKLSYAERKKVGGVAITPQDVMLTSWNGRPAGDPNECELDGVDVTHPHVLHCESNLVAKAAREGISLKGSSVFVTLSPCLPCAMQMFQAGVISVIYDEQYRLTDGIDFLKTHKVNIEKYEESV
ncbi:cytidine and deoxycytidylate deaminase zinc-binding region [Pseudomonas phage phiPto-bp6g]|nr:cytidine and deoxycytidylate deaminase zinc-binding region [Pseudomonas phage phiPto-bp6g]